MDNLANEQLINRYFYLFNQHHWTKMAELYAETADFKDPSFGTGIVEQTRQQIVDKYSELQQVFPDLHDEVQQLYLSGEKHVIVEFVSTGTAADGSVFELPICTIFTIEDGKIIKDFSYYDNFDEKEFQ
ncbi:MAG: nuclear transport factor 2 family protein [Chryseobacterium sp.]|nr:MAG: nuclear transport factor 2 family protein [Chryseobacterium sp.]